jgi:hypothetical protein
MGLFPSLACEASPANGLFPSLPREAGPGDGFLFPFLPREAGPANGFILFSGARPLSVPQAYSCVL